MQGLVTRNAHVIYESPTSVVPLPTKKIWQRLKVFHKKVKVTRLNLWYDKEGLITKNALAKYTIPISILVHEL